MKQIISKPHITEKSMAKVSDNLYTFQIDKTANKHEVAKLIEETYKVNVISVNIITKQGKIKNFRGKKSGITKKYKCAVVRIKKDQKIADFIVKE